MSDGSPRSFTFGGILDGAFTLYRRNFVTFFGAAFVPQIPVVVFWLAAPLWMAPGAAGGVPDSTLAGILLFPYSVFAMFLTLGAVTHAGGEAYAGRAAGLGESLRRGLGRWIPLAVAGGLAWIAVVVGLLFFIVPGLILTAMFFAVGPAAVLEGRGPAGSLERSKELSRGGRARVLGVLLVAWLITLAPTMAMWGIGGVGAFAVQPGAELEVYETWMGLAQVAGPLVSSLTWPFFITVIVLLYFDRRARTEASDLEVAMDRLEPEA